MAALVAVTVITASRPEPAVAAPLGEIATLTIDPSCSAAPTSEFEQLAVNVHGSGFQPGQTVVLYSAYPDLPTSPIPGLSPSAVQSNGTFDAAVSLVLGGAGTIQVFAYYQGATPEVGGGIVSQTIIQIPCPAPTITLSQTCAEANQPFDLTITANGFQVGTPLFIAFKLGDAVLAQPADQPTPDTSPYTYTLPIPALGTAVYTVVALQEPPVPTGPVILESASATATAYLVVPCAQLVIAPTCITTPTQQFTLSLVGALFQPNLSVNIVFDPRISDPAGQPEYFGSVLAAADGTWSAEISPYARGPGTYDVVALQYIDSTLVSVTHATTPLTIMDGPCPAGQLVPNPTCSDPLLTGDAPHSFALAVHGTGFQAGMQLTLIFDAEGLAGPSFTPEVSTPAVVAFDGQADWTFPNGVSARPVGTYQITAYDQSNTAVTQAAFGMPCQLPNAQLRQLKPKKCGDDVATNPSVVYSILVRGTGFLPGYVDIQFDGTAQPPASADANGQFQTTLSIPGRGPGAYQIVATQSDAFHNIDQVSRTFTVPCSVAAVPTITISPGSVAPGFVVEVTGVGFAPNKPVALYWSDGIEAGQPIVVTAEDDGTFTRQVLLFAHDFSGTREMTAGTTSNPNAYPSAKASLLVAAGQGLPPSITIVGGNPGDQPPLILRR